MSITALPLHFPHIRRKEDKRFAAAEHFKPYNIQDPLKMNHQSLFLLVLLISAFYTTSNGDKILVFVGVSSHSHRVAIQPLATKLSEAGHDVTIFSPIKPEVENPKIKEFCTQALKDMNAQMAEDTTWKAALGRIQDRFYDPFFEGDYMLDLLYGMAVAVIKNPKFLEWIQNSHFDLIIFDSAGKEFLFPIAHHMKAKMIEFIPTVMPIHYAFDAVGYPLEPWLNSFLENSYSLIPDRWFNAYASISWYRRYKNYQLPRVEALAREVFPFDFPPLEELIKKTDLVFMNNHPSMGHSAAYPPFVIPVAGLHAKDSNGTLPKDIKDFLADTERFVFISFGSIIRVSALPQYMQQILFDAVAAVPNTKFLWKWESDFPKNLPKNALAKKWFPQQDVLAHPKCKGFITQGGLMSLQQSVYHNVPVLVIPGFGDQPFNAQMANKAGYGIHLELSEITKETFSYVLSQLLNSPIYSNKMKQVSREFKDRPMPAVDTAVWWVEYVLRHDTSHLKSESVQLEWWERRMLDLWIALFLGLSSVAGLGSYLLYVMFTRLARSQNSKKLKGL